jgi:hypothetical protein
LEAHRSAFRQRAKLRFAEPVDPAHFFKDDLIQINAEQPNQVSYGRWARCLSRIDRSAGDETEVSARAFSLQLQLSLQKCLAQIETKASAAIGLAAFANPALLSSP